jgi:transposase
VVSRERRLFSREFKLAAIARLADAPNVLDLARDLGVRREMLYKWQAKFASGGAAALNTTGRPRPVVSLPPGSEAGVDDATRAARRVGELERKVGQQQLEIDFFRAALRHLKDRGPKNGGPGGPASTR